MNEEVDLCNFSQILCYNCYTNIIRGDYKMLETIILGLSALASLTGFSSGTNFEVTKEDYSIIAETQDEIIISFPNNVSNFRFYTESSPIGDRNKGRISIKDLEIMHA